MNTPMKGVTAELISAKASGSGSSELLLTSPAPTSLKLREKSMQLMKLKQGGKTGGEMTTTIATRISMKRK